MAGKSPMKSPSKSPQERRLQVEYDLDKVKTLMDKPPKSYEELVSWKNEADLWIGKIETWLSDTQVMSSAYLKPKLMSTFRKLGDLFENIEKQELKWQEEIGVLYHHRLPKRGEPLNNDQFEKMLFSKYNNPTFENDNKGQK